MDGMVGGSGNVVLPASQTPPPPPLLSAAAAGGGVLQAAVSARDQILGLEAYRAWRLRLASSESLSSSSSTSSSKWCDEFRR